MGFAVIEVWWPERARGVASRVRALAASRLGLFLLVALGLEAWVRGVVGRAAGGPSAPLDDAFIHFQYARSIAELHPFRYGSPVEAPSSGATSVLYAFVLAVPWLLGFRGERLILAAQVVDGVAWALAAEGMYRVGRAAWGRTAGGAAAAVTFACAGMVWAACSCMETVLAVCAVAWVFALVFELDEARGHGTVVALAAVGALAPFVRPELVALSLLAAAVVALRARGRDRWRALLPLAAAPALPVFWRVVTGAWRTSGAMVKWLPYDPYLTRGELRQTVREVVEKIGTEVLAGQGWAERYFPEGFHRVVALGFVLVVARAIARRRVVSALAWCGAAALLVLPATFRGWDLHRYRYLWPVFAMPLACAAVAACAVGDALDRLRAWVRGAAPEGLAAVGLAGVLCGTLGIHVDGAVEDLAECAAAIRGQQVTLATRDVARLPAGSRVLINDAGALAYLGGHATLDFVGLTTLALAEPWMHGVGSVYEALEALAPAARPTHAALYRDWLNADALFGAPLASATVTRQTILGGSTMELLPVEDALFGRGSRPLVELAPGEAVVDEVDVAHLPSERAHRYEVESVGRGDNLVRDYGVTGVGAVLDGGRVVRRREAMTLRGRAGRAARVYLRTDAWYPLRLRVRWNGAVLEERLPVEAAHAYVDVPIVVPAEKMRADNRLEVFLLEGQDYGSFHYFLVQGP